MTHLTVTRLPLISYAVRIHSSPEDPSYETGFVVSPKELGKVLWVGLLMGKPMGIRGWVEAAAEHFPRAEEVSYERLTRDGWRRERRRFRAKGASYWDRCKEHLRSYYLLPETLDQIPPE